jgi:hypothetical protein
MKTKLALFSLLSLFALPAFAATQFSLDSMISTVIYLVIIGLVFWAVLWFVGYVGVPEPFNKIIKVVMALFALIIVLNLLLGMAGTPLFSMR